MGKQILYMKLVEVLELMLKMLNQLDLSVKRVTHSNR
jgi:hypothetical protein